MRRLLASVAAAGLLSAGVIMTAAGTANAAGCATVADTPSKSGDTASGRGGREGCTSTVSWVKVRLVHYQPLGPHPIMAQNRKDDIKNKTWTVYWTRPNSSTANGWDWYTAAESSSGQKTESARKRLWP